ncbi:MAG: hypothetical protein HY872_00045 [Chloroflexi bacterium]|nr:hypothetical protein [Chloroflexota bacterium]
MLSSRRAYSTLWWVGYYTFCLLPLVVLAMGIGRYFYARAEMFKSADGAALAAAQEVDVPTYLSTKQIVLLPSAYGVAQAYAAYNSDYLTGRRIYPRVTTIRVDQVVKKVYVSLQADASSLFPSILRGVVVNGEGEAEARLQSR